MWENSDLGFNKMGNKGCLFQVRKKHWAGQAISRKTWNLHHLKFINAQCPNKFHKVPSQTPYNFKWPVTGVSHAQESSWSPGRPKCSHVKQWTSIDNLRWGGENC